MLCMSKVFASITKAMLRRWFRFLYRLSGWLLTTRRSAWLAEMPKHLKRDGNKAFKEGNCKLAKEQSIKVLGIDPNTTKTNATFYSGTFHSKLREPYDAIEDCTDAGKLGGMCVKAFWRRAQCYMDTEVHDQGSEEAGGLWKRVLGGENTRTGATKKMHSWNWRRVKGKITSPGQEATSEYILK